MEYITCTLPSESGIRGTALADELIAAGYAVGDIGGGIYDITHYCTEQTVVINTDATQEQAQAVVDAHDPVFITATRDGDIVTVNISKPNNVDSVTELTPTFDDVPAETARPLVDNAATFTLRSADPVTIGIVENYKHTEVTI